MSSSPKEQQEETVERQSVDELEEPQQEADNEAGEQPILFNPPGAFLTSILCDGPSTNVILFDIQPDVPGTAEATENPPVKRGRGRPKGSKNKKTVSAATGATSTTPAVPRKRGRPPKVIILVAFISLFHHPISVRGCPEPLLIPRLPKTAQARARRTCTKEASRSSAQESRSGRRRGGCGEWRSRWRTECKEKAWPAEKDGIVIQLFYPLPNTTFLRLTDFSRLPSCYYIPLLIVFRLCTTSRYPRLAFFLLGFGVGFYSMDTCFCYRFLPRYLSVLYATSNV